MINGRGNILEVPVDDAVVVYFTPHKTELAIK
jgi:hypothetical protein